LEKGMKHLIVLILLIGLVGALAGPVWSQNPFTSKQDAQAKPPKPLLKSRFFTHLIVWQHQLKERMAGLVRAARERSNPRPLLFLMLIAFAYGAIHAAGPGHGKFVAISYVLSHRTTRASGIFLGMGIALVHGLSGVVGVVGLHYLLSWGASDTLTRVTGITQIVSFGLIVLLGAAIFVKHTYALLNGTRGREGQGVQPRQNLQSKQWVPWAAAIGLVPCPAVVMTMLFCLSMEVIVLGLVLAACITLGMATTIAAVASLVVAGKAGLYSAVSSIGHSQTIELGLGMLSGAAVFAFGIVFLLSAINAINH
jgi:ABC-type nickel/cobalt efflux system permease component RcnA